MQLKIYYLKHNLFTNKHKEKKNLIALKKKNELKILQ